MNNTITSLKTELLSKRRILKYLGVTAHEIPHYQPNEVWMDIAAYRNGKGVLVSGSRVKIKKNIEMHNSRDEKVRQIVCDFEEKYNAMTCYVLLKRAIQKEENEVAILFVNDDSERNWQQERINLRKLTPQVYVCKLNQPENGEFKTIKCRVIGGKLGMDDALYC